MSRAPVSLVDILREFLEAHLLLQRLATRFVGNELTFSELQELIGDDESSVLFRLKEKCHGLFRPGAGAGEFARAREALFDLAVGSLFHEAMKFREDFYQREVYGPRVEALRREAGHHADGLFQEFERILSKVSVRLEAGLAETQALMTRSWEQLRVLLAEHPDDGFVTRFLIEHSEAVDLIGPGLDALLGEIHKDAAEGYAVAGRSYLDSGHYSASVRSLDEAVARGAEASEVEPLACYARGMAAYLDGRYAESVERLEEWIEAGRLGPDALGSVAHAALSSVDQLLADEDRNHVLKAAKQLLTKLQPPSRERPAHHS